MDYPCYGIGESRTHMSEDDPWFMGYLEIPVRCMGGLLLVAKRDKFDFRFF
jgi:hypothetical protein